MMGEEETTVNHTTKGINDRWPSSACIQSHVRVRLQTLDAGTRRFVAKRPYMAVLMVAAAGYLVARIASRY